MELFILGIAILFLFFPSTWLAKKIETPLKIPIKSDPLLPKHLIIIGPDAFGRFAWKNLKTGASGCYKIAYNDLVTLLKEKS